MKLSGQEADDSFINVNRMIEVFKTNVKKRSDAKRVVSILLQHFPASKINFDLQDCDKILRIEGERFIVERIMRLVKESGYQCDVLD
jgi:hypothetical protein